MPAAASLPDLFSTLARRWPGRIALIDGDTAMTYAEVDQAATGLAAALRQEGVARGNHGRSGA